MTTNARLSRPPIERMLRIHEELRRGAFTNCTKLAERLEVSRKTIVRDVAFMRDRLDLPIEFDSRINAYRYTHPVSAFPTVQVTEGNCSRCWWRARRWSNTEGHPSIASWRLPSRN